MTGEQQGGEEVARAHLELELLLDAEPIRGRLALPARDREWEFTGWMALVGALEKAIAEAGEEDPVEAESADA